MHSSAPQPMLHSSDRGAAPRWESSTERRDLPLVLFVPEIESLSSCSTGFTAEVGLDVNEGRLTDAEVVVW